MTKKADFSNRNIVKNSLGFDSNLYIYQDKDMFNYSVDTILLGNFVFLNKKITHILEIGTNNGALSIFIADRNPKIHIDAIEIQQKAATLAQHNVELNNKEKQINVICEDFNNFYANHAKQSLRKYQSIVVNPPFYTIESTKIGKKITEEIKIATFEVALNLEQIFIGCSKIIEQKGYLTMVVPVERMVDCFEHSRKYNFEPKRIQFIIPRVNDKPKLVLIEYRYQAGWGVHFLPNLYLHSLEDKNNHDYLPEIKELYKPIKV